MRVTAVSMLLVGLLVGCGSGSGGRADTIQDQPTGDTRVPTAKTPVNTLTSGQIKGALLRLSDMPTGFTRDKSKDDSADTPSGCKKLDALDDFDKRVLAKGEAKFTGGTFGPFVDEAVSVPRQAAKVYYDQFRDAMQACHRFRAETDDGTNSNATLTGLSFPTFGDDTFAAQMRIAPIPMVGSVYVDLVVVRLGNALMLLSEAQVAAPPDGSSVEQLCRTAVKRLQRA